MIRPGSKKNRGRCPVCGSKLVSLGGITRCADHRRCSFVEHHYDHDTVKVSDRKTVVKRDEAHRKKKASKKIGRKSPISDPEMEAQLERIKSRMVLTKPEEIPEEIKDRGKAS